MNTYNVMTYGAIGNGIANDTTALQATITAAYAAGGGIVHLPTGTYLFDTPLELETGVSLEGDKLSLLKTIGDIAGIRLHDGSQVLRGFTICGGNNDPTVYTADHVGIYAPAGPVQDVLIDGVSVYHFGAMGIALAQPTRCAVKNCQVCDNGNEGIFFSHGTACHDNIIEHNNIHGNGCNGIDTNADGIIIRGNEIYGNGVAKYLHPAGVDCHGICIASIGGITKYNGDLFKVVVEGNHIYNNYSCGISASAGDNAGHNLFSTTDGLIISNNNIHANGDPASSYRHGIEVVSSAGCTMKNVTVSGNVVTDGHYDSMRVYGDATYNVVITGNVFRDAEVYPVHIDKATQVTINGNQLEPSVHANSIGIYLTHTASNNHISGNTINNCKAFNVFIEAGCLQNQIVDNYFYQDISGSANGVSDAGTGTIILRNEGHKAK